LLLIIALSDNKVNEKIIDFYKFILLLNVVLTDRKLDGVTILLGKLNIIEKKVRLATIVALSVNIVLGTSKIFVGLIFSSMALIADGFDSIMDLFMGILAYLGTIFSRKPADKNHLYGHEKVEMIFLILIILVIYITGLGILLQALDKLISEEAVEFSIIGLVIVIISIVGKIGISYYVYQTGTQVNSNSLKATGLNYMTDVVSSSLALIAIIGAYAGFGIIDSIAALFICGLIFYGATRMLLETLDILIDRAPSEEIQNKINSISGSIEGVKEVHFLRARVIQNMIIGDIHILVNPDFTVREGHQISEAVSSELEKQLGAKIIVHLEPYDEENILKK
jgi:cation diffusion facilitator family transporter